MSKNKKKDLRVVPSPDDPIMMLATILSAAWEKYALLLGECPRGTPAQLAALLELTGEFKELFLKK